MSAKSKKLQELMSLIGSKYVFNKENYPKLDDSSPETKQMFAISHSNFHMQKSLGKIAEVCEEYDHKGNRTHQGITKVEESTVKMFINTLKLAEELGFSAEELFERVEQFYKDR
ncbi:MAG: hypothetical protein KBB88_01485 [Candidatus Pacebacteria bacterium]|nr:hypothetical protein [Candidatus Paceibacterota bacterium]